MNKLQCKVCGGKLVFNENDIAVCEYCGMEYKPEALQKMLVELSGTIEVQGINSKRRLIEKAEALERIGKIGDALKVYTEIAEEYPDEYIGFYKLCKYELENIQRTHHSNPWRNPFAFSEDLIKSLNVLNPEKAEEMKQLLAQKLNDLIEFDYEFDCCASQSSLCCLVESLIAGKYVNEHPSLSSWNKEKYDHINSIFQDMISAFDTTSRECYILWAHGNRAIVIWVGTRIDLGCLVTYKHSFHIILNCRFEDDEDAFLRELVAHQYVATTTDPNWGLIPPFTWAGWEEKKRQREIENQRRAMQIQEEQRRKQEEQRRKQEEQRRRGEAQRQQWIRDGRCAYCGGIFESVKVGLFAKELRCKFCRKQKDY